MGMVFLAEDTLLNIKVALKFINPTDASRELLERFKREVLLARQVTHPSICRIYDIHEEGSHLFISMEYVEGRTLLSLIHDAGKLPVAQATEIARNVCRAVGAAHQHGVIHRDLKPSNVIVRGRSRVSVLDFGLAKSSQLEQITGVGARVGTVVYMAPEVLAGEASSAISDIYSTGVMLYESVTGRLPFTSNDLVVLLYQVEHQRWPAPSSLNPAVTPALGRAIERALAVNPEKRFQSVDALQEALNDALAELPDDAEGGATSQPWHGDVDESIQEALLDKRSSGVIQAAALHTTVMFSDMVGITPYFEKYGEATGIRRIQLHNKLLGPVVEEHRGKVIKFIGDAIMASFATADDAVAAAIQMQYKLAAHNHTVTRPDDKIFVRIGLHSEPTAISSSNAFSDTISVAARASALAGSEQVLLSAVTRGAISAYRELTRLFGHTEVKGKPARYELFELLWRNAPPPANIGSDPGNPFAVPLVSAATGIENQTTARLAVLNSDDSSPLQPSEATEKYEIPARMPGADPFPEATVKVPIPTTRQPHAAVAPVADFPETTAPGVAAPEPPVAATAPADLAMPVATDPVFAEPPKTAPATPFEARTTSPLAPQAKEVIRPAMVLVGRPAQPRGTGTSDEDQYPLPDAPRRGGRIIAGLVIGAALVAAGAWWLTQERAGTDARADAAQLALAAGDASVGSPVPAVDAAGATADRIDAATEVETVERNVDAPAPRNVQPQQAFRRRETELYRRMADLGIIRGDLPAFDQELNHIGQLKRQTRWRDGLEAIRRAANLLDNTPVDADFVKAKYKRFNRISGDVTDEATLKALDGMLNRYIEATEKRDFAAASRALSDAIVAVKKQ